MISLCTRSSKSVVEIHCRDSGRAIFAGCNQGPCMAQQHGKPPTTRSDAALTVVSTMWMGTRGNVRSCPHCRRLCSPTPAVEGKDVQANAAESINYGTLAACSRCTLSPGDQQRKWRISPTWYAVPQFILSPLQCSTAAAIFKLPIKNRIVANELRMFQKTNLTSLWSTVLH